MTKEKVIARLVKRGWNKEDAKKCVEANFDYAIKGYSDATINLIADFCVTVH